MPKFDKVKWKARYKKFRPYGIAFGCCETIVFIWWLAKKGKEIRLEKGAVKKT